MNCEPADTATIEAEIRLARAAALYQPTVGALQTLHLRFVLPRAVGADALFLIRSQRSADWLYRGPFTAALTLGFDARLAADGGSDNLHFFLFDPAAGLACAWLNERGERYWVDGATVDVELLDHGRFGPDGLFQQHGVRIDRR